MVSKTIVGVILPRVRIPHSPQMIYTINDINTIIILNGTISDNDIASLRHINCVMIAADGAANTLIANNIVPHFIVGDMDSVNKDIITFHCQLSQFINIKNQEQYDFEKCLDFCIKNGFNNIMVYGMNGGLLDHTLNNWSIFIKYSDKLNLFSYVLGQIGVLIRNDIVIDAIEDSIISIIPSPTATLTSKGLEWNLNNTRLELGSKEGARNKSISKKVEIQLHSGKYMLFYTIKL